MPTDVRVRVAPSPTGYLHLGLAWISEEVTCSAS